MNVRAHPSSSARLTYCTNVHPGESLQEVRQVLATSVREVKSLVAPTEDFGVGLRLSALACAELEQSGAIEEVRHELSSAGLHVFTLNGFPYGQFSGTRVKERVYRPDWLEPERIEYTQSLARVLAALLRPGEVGSISTVPLCYKPRASSPRDYERMALSLVRVVAELVQLERSTGKYIALALEPEPFCALETTDEVLRFFREHLWAAAPVAELGELCGLDPTRSEAALRRHIGVCLDACHAAVEFENPLDVLRSLHGAGIVVPKIQVSAGLVVRELARHERSIAAFADDTYLHQVVVRGERGLERFLDLREAIERSRTRTDRAEWRVHFHVPVFQGELDPFGSTQAELSQLLRASETLEIVPHLEVETYTFDLLPARYKTTSVVEAIARELTWTLEELSASGTVHSR